MLRMGVYVSYALLREVHIVTFPSDDAFASYRRDPELAPLAALREAAIVETEILVGDDGPDYHLNG